MTIYVTDDGRVEWCHIGQRGDDVWFCTGHSVEYTDREEYEAHKDERHPKVCDFFRRRHDHQPVLAAYRYRDGQSFNDYCAECAEREWDENEEFREKAERQPRTANEDAERLPDDHPLEQQLAED